MLKVLVIDSGWGGELFADYLEDNLRIIEVVREIDWRGGAYADVGESEIRTRVERLVGIYVGRVDVIILASYVVTAVMLEELKNKYPRQKFVGFDFGLSQKIQKFKGRKVMMLAPGLVRKSKNYEKEKENLRRFEVLEPCCEGWIRKIDDGEMTESMVRRSLKGTKEVDIVLLYETGLMDIKGVFEKIYGWKVWVIDDFSRVLRNICFALGLKGVDGKRSK